MILNVRSEKNLAGVHPDLVRIVRRAAEILPNNDPVGFIVTEGVRTVERQRQLVATGASRTMRSRHLVGPDGYAKAFDLAVTVNGNVEWAWPLYEKMSLIVKQAACDVNVSIEWGGDWASFRDGPHYQLPERMYP